MGALWHVVVTKPQQEQRVVLNIRRLGLRPLLPCYIVERIVHHRVVHVALPLFPRYCFVLFDLNRDPWQRLFGCYGVKRLIGGEHPQPLPPHEAERMVELFDSGPIASLDLAVGELVKIITGPWQGQSGRITAVRPDAVEVLLSLFRREMVVPVARAFVLRQR
ncbi:MAG: transcription termination/antitermination protein NusG [Stellaceae bacterium]